MLLRHLEMHKNHKRKGVGEGNLVITWEQKGKNEIFRAGYLRRVGEPAFGRATVSTPITPRSINATGNPHNSSDFCQYLQDNCNFC